LERFPECMPSPRHFRSVPKGESLADALAMVRGKLTRGCIGPQVVSRGQVADSICGGDGDVKIKVQIASSLTAGSPEPEPTSVPRQGRGLERDRDRDRERGVWRLGRLRRPGGGEVAPPAAGAVALWEVASRLRRRLGCGARGGSESEHRPCHPCARFLSARNSLAGATKAAGVGWGWGGCGGGVEWGWGTLDVPARRTVVCCPSSKSGIGESRGRIEDLQRGMPNHRNLRH
jgi:hypothetical protein